MKKVFLSIISVAAAITCFTGSAFAQNAAAPPQDSVPPASPQEIEAMYTTAIESRAADIIVTLKLTDPAKSARVHDLIIAQYRTLKSRDAAIDALVTLQGKEINYANRAPLLVIVTPALHDQFLAKLSADLTPAQVDVIKDKMTYNKVRVTYDAYCSILPNLSDAEKARILASLQAAREEAMNGGSAKEKSAIFQQYKDQINAYLTADGHDVAKAFKDYETKQQAANKSPDESAPKAAPAGK
jgi:hypothetical protein